VPKTGKGENGGGGTRTEKSTAASHCRPGMAYSRRSTEPIRIQYRRLSQKTVSAVTRRLSGSTCLRRFRGVFFLRLGAVFASRNAAAGSLPLHSTARGARRSYVLHHVAARNHRFPEGWGERALRSQTTLAYPENVGSQFLSLRHMRLKFHQFLGLYTFNPRLKPP
jgi:hypothetical protein